MDDLHEWFGRFGGAVLIPSIAIGSFFGAIAAGAYAAKVTNRNYVGWVVGLLAYVLTVVVFGPAHQALRRESCHGEQDHRGCPNDDYDFDGADP